MEPTLLNGLKKPSLIKLNKLATIDKDLVLGKLGNLSPEEIGILDQNLIAPEILWGMYVRHLHAKKRIRIINEN